jgi:hypothetical protein
MGPKDWSDTSPDPLGQPRECEAVDVCRDIIADLSVLASTALDGARNGIEPDFTDLDVETLRLKRAMRQVWKYPYGRR